MANHIVIYASDANIAAKIHQDLVSRQVPASRMSRDQGVKFGMKVGIVDLPAQEFIEIVNATPDMVEAVFDTIERFRDRMKLFMDDEPREIAARPSGETSFTKPKTFEDLFKRPSKQ